MRELPDHAVLLASSVTCPVQMFRIKSHLYATQFHPELDLVGLLTRIEAYREHGYFPAATAGLVVERARLREVIWPMRVLRNFVARYGRE